MEQKIRTRNSTKNANKFELKEKVSVLNIDLIFMKQFMSNSSIRNLCTNVFEQIRYRKSEAKKSGQQRKRMKKFSKNLESNHAELY